MFDTAIIGNLQEILPFRVMGFLIHPMDDLTKEQNINSVLKNILLENHKVIFVTEEFYDITAEILESLRFSQKENLPVIIPITNGIEFKDTGKKQLKQLVERAIGIDIFKEQ